MTDNWFAPQADSTPYHFPMQKWNRFPRVIFLLALLTSLLAGISAPTLMDESANAAPLAICPDPTIAQWTFTGDVVTPSTGGSEIFSSGTGLLPAAPPYSFATGEIPSENNAITFTGLNTVLLDNTGYVGFQIDTTGRSAINFNFKSRITVTGPTVIDLYYSTDNWVTSTFYSSINSTTFPPFINDASWHTYNFDLSSITALDNNPNVAIRLFAYGASASGGTWRIDNVTFIGDCPYTPLSLLINEVAWAGTLASSDDEWIELYNPSLTTSINLSDGWRLVADDGSPDIALSGTINPDSYFLLERVSEQVTNVPHNQFFSGSLDDIGEVLRLRAPDGTIVDTANSGGGAWYAGAISPNGSMERMGVIPDTPLAWVTNINAASWTNLDAALLPIHGTPGRANWGYSVTQTPTPTITPSPTSTPTSTPTLTPTPSASMSILINEVAWGGTLASSTDEWIELYNPGTVPINLAGWRLSASDGNPSINLNGVVLPVGGYYVLASNSAVFTDVTVDQTFSGSFSNEGELMRLFDGSNTVIDTANSDSGAWPAGSGSPNYASMERIGKVTDGKFSWATYASAVVVAHDRNNNAIKGTPGKSNWAITVTLTPTATVTATRPPTATNRAPTSTFVPLSGRPIINEFLPRPGFDWNQDGKVDVFDEFIEIKNIGNADMSLSGWILDDEANQGSSPFNLPAVTLKVGERMVFYGLQTNILLGDGGDTVRLINTSGKIYDAYTYKIAKVEDESVCRLMDGNGSWYEDCVPTPNLTNTRKGVVPSMPGGVFESPVCDLPDTLPADFLFAECRGYGANIWHSFYWDRFGWQGGQYIPENMSKWESFVE